MIRYSDALHRHADRILGLILLIATLGVYWQVQSHDFIYFDDPAYVTNNTYVKAGLTGEGFVWAFSSFSASNWHPLTWLSHMLDSRLFGCNPAGHHLTSVFFHAANTLLLFLFLSQATGRLWRSFMVAGLFALHPLHIESVAWVSERKDVLSAFFWMLALVSYVRYATTPKPSWYLCTLLLFALGLLSKPMVVTLPFVLLLIDYWPLGRFQFEKKMDWAKIWRVFVEKAPFLVLSAGSCVVTIMAQEKAIQGLKRLPVHVRLENALVSYVQYILKMFWPQDLAVFYPHPGDALPWWSVGMSLMALAGITGLSVYWLRRRPYVCVGFFWFIGTLIPVIGIVQVGMQAMADRYTYIPLIGLFAAIVWGCSEFFQSKGTSVLWKAMVASVIGILLAASTFRQLGCWRDTRSLAVRALEVTKDNYAAHFLLARAEAADGNMEQALHHYHTAVSINPGYVAQIYNRVGYFLAGQGRLEEAVLQFRESLKIRSDYASAHNNLGVALARMGRFDDAVSELQAALEICPGYEEAKKNLENVQHDRLKRKGKPGGQ